MNNDHHATGSLDTGTIVVKSIDISALVPYEQNAKIHSQEQIKNIALSIQKYGWRQPIVIDENNVIVIGHGRYLAAKTLGLQRVPVTFADDLSPEQIRELRIVDNKTNESPWDYAKLDVETAELEFSDFTFDFCIDDPFSDAELEQIMQKEVEQRAREVHRVTVDCNNADETILVEKILKDAGYNPQVKNV